MLVPAPSIFVFLQSRKDLVDYTNAMQHVINTIAAYYKKNIDDVLFEVLNKE